VLAGIGVYLTSDMMIVNYKKDHSSVMARVGMVPARSDEMGYVLEAASVIAIRFARKPADPEVLSHTPQPRVGCEWTLPSSSSYHQSPSQDEPTLEFQDRYLGYRYLHLHHHSCQKPQVSALPSRCASSL